MAKLNCWDFMNCGRQPGGRNVADVGICPAACLDRYDGVNGGKFAGRFCWYVSGTYCGGDIQGTFARKIGDCLYCEFFLNVENEEGMNLIFIEEDIEND
jgi:hypothetical protein